MLTTDHQGGPGMVVEAHPASYPVGTGATLPGVKWPGHEADHFISI